MDFPPTIVGGALASASIPFDVGVWHSFDVTNLVRGWVNGSLSNQGLIVRGPEGSGDNFAWIGFYTSESYSEPYLKITYPGVAASEEIVPTVEKVPDPAAYRPADEDQPGVLSIVSDSAAPESVEQTVYCLRD